MNTNEVLKLALEALEYIYEGANNQGPHTGISWRCVSNKAAPAITALRQALANEALDKMAENARELGLDYEHPTQYWRAYASDYERGVIDGMQKQMQSSVDRAVNAMAGQPAQQEPVAWMSDVGSVASAHEKKMGYVLESAFTTPLYTSPPAQQNIRNATLDEIATKIEAMPFGDTAASFAVWIREQKT